MMNSRLLLLTVECRGVEEASFRLLESANRDARWKLSPDKNRPHRNVKYRRATNESMH